jgi:hypothetical protein
LALRNSLTAATPHFHQSSDSPKWGEAAKFMDSISQQQIRGPTLNYN